MVKIRELCLPVCSKNSPYHVRYFQNERGAGGHDNKLFWHCTKYSVVEKK